MPTQFDWETDEEAWGGRAEILPDASSRFPRWRNVYFIVLIFLGVGVLVAGFTFLRAQQRVEEVTNALNQPLLSTHMLLQKSALLGDNELFSLTLLPSNDWREIQQELLVSQLFWNRSSLGLWLDLASFDPEDESQIGVEYSPDLRIATVMGQLPYVTVVEDDVLQPVTLERTAVYQRVDERWLYAPFPVEFWGDEILLNGRNLSIRGPQRDEEIIEELLPDIDQLITDACNLPDLKCPTSLQVELIFQTEAESSFELNRNYQVNTVYRADSGRVLQVQLPTPTLVGLPIDEDGYQVLRDGYAAQVIASVMSNIDSNCCSFGPDVPSVFALQLQAIGLQPPKPAGYHPQSHLIATPLPLPNQDIIALCQVGSLGTVLRYDHRTTIWTEEYIPQNGFVSQMLAANGDGVFLTTFPSRASSESRLEWLVNGESILIDTSEDWISLSAVLPDWEGSRDTVVVFYKQIEDEQWQAQMLMIDPSSCTPEAGCSFKSLSTYSLFSPEKTHSLVRIIDGSFAKFPPEYWLGDALGQPVEKLQNQNIVSPKWRNEQSFLFVYFLEDYVVASGLAQMPIEREGEDYQLGEMDILLTDDEVKQFLGDDEDTVDYAIASIVSSSEHVGDVVQIFVMKSSRDEPSWSGYLLTYDTRTDGLDWTEPFAHVELLPNITFSPNGRFMQAVELKDERQTLHLLDTETGKLQSFPLANGIYYQDYDWSADGNWMLLADGDELSLIAPAHAYIRKVYSPATSCNTAVWVNRDS